MKTIKNIALIAIVILLGLTSCKKTNDFGGAASIKGNVTLKGVSVNKAIVYLSLGATTASSNHDATTVTDDAGNYSFKGLLRGDYFVTAEYTNATGQTFTSGGGHVTIGDKKGTVTADLTVQ